MVYKETPQATIEWDEADKVVSITWRAYADGIDYRNLLTALLDLAEEKRAFRLLADTRKAKVVTPDDQAWVDAVWGPRALKAGVRFTALLVPESMVAKLSLDRMRAKYTVPVGGGTEFFTNIDEAKTWLRATR